MCPDQLGFLGLGSICTGADEQWGAGVQAGDGPGDELKPETH